jgi:hypothetical protein
LQSLGYSKFDSTVGPRVGPLQHVLWVRTQLDMYPKSKLHTCETHTSISSLPRPTNFATLNCSVLSNLHSRGREGDSGLCQEATLYVLPVLPVLPSVRTSFVAFLDILHLELNFLAPLTPTLQDHGT